MTEEEYKEHLVQFIDRGFSGWQHHIETSGSEHLQLSPDFRERTMTFLESCTPDELMWLTCGMYEFERLHGDPQEQQDALAASLGMEVMTLLRLQVND